MSECVPASVTEWRYYAQGLSLGTSHTHQGTHAQVHADVKTCRVPSFLCVAMPQQGTAPSDGRSNVNMTQVPMSVTKILCGGRKVSKLVLGKQTNSSNMHDNDNNDGDGGHASDDADDVNSLAPQPWLCRCNCCAPPAQTPFAKICCCAR